MKQLYVKISESQVKKLQYCSSALGLGVAEVIRRAVDKGLPEMLSEAQEALEADEAFKRLEKEKPARKREPPLGLSPDFSL